MIGLGTSRRSLEYILSVAIGLSALPTAIAIPATAAATATSAPTSRLGHETGLPIPRFVSLKSSNARMRIGPSTDYGTKFVYKAARLPLEIIEEYDNWRQVRDCDGVTGWMHRSLLSSRRTAIVGPWLREPAAINAQPGTRSDVLALLSPRVLLGIKRCDGKWCTVQVFGHDLTGFVAQQALCGVYANEAMD